jgi:CRISPR/Cas system-associated protein endoribonuclease Cas2
MRHSSSEENAQVHINRVKIHLPADGEVRIIKITACHISCDLHLGDSRLQLPCLKCFNTGVLSFFLVKKMIIVPVLFR